MKQNKIPCDITAQNKPLPVPTARTQNSTEYETTERYTTEQLIVSAGGSKPSKQLTELNDRTGQNNIENDT